MMKRHLCLTALALALCSSLLAGCGSNRYVLVTSDYGIHVASGKPRLDPKNDTYSFRDETGSEVVIPRADLKQMRELRD